MITTEDFVEVLRGLFAGFALTRDQVEEYINESFRNWERHGDTLTLKDVTIQFVEETKDRYKIIVTTEQDDLNVNVGDCFKYTTHLHDGESEITIRYKILEFLPDGSFRVAVRNDELIILKRHILASESISLDEFEARR